MGQLRFAVDNVVHAPIWFLVLAVAASGLHGGAVAACFAYLAYLTLILLHELGHALMAWGLGLKVTRIELHLLHGRCLFLPGGDELRNVAVYWGGVLAQLVLFGAFLIMGLYFTLPQPMGAVLIVWGPYNLLVIAANLWPKAPRDGARAWRIFPLALRRLRLRLNLPVRVAGSTPLRSQADLLAFVLGTPDLRRHLASMGFAPEPLLSALASLGPERRGTLAALMDVIQSAEALNVAHGRASVATPLNLFVVQVRYGESQIRQALESAGLDVRGLLFRIAHGKSEAEFSMSPDQAGDRAVSVRLMNDDFTPMDLVVALLLKHLSISRPDAVSLMLEVHRKGSAALLSSSYGRANTLAVTLNAEARQAYAPLLCKLVAEGG